SARPRRNPSPAQRPTRRPRPSGYLCCSPQVLPRRAEQWHTVAFEQDRRVSIMSVQPTDDPEMQDEASTFDARLEDVRAAPSDEGIVELIVSRPAEGDRELLDEARIDEDLGLIGDRWSTRDVDRTPAYLSAQLTVISTRVLA